MLSDKEYMWEAVLEGRQALNKTGNNPPVGVVIVYEGEVIGKGHTSMQGGNHAEINALLEAGDGANGATLYSTLEPCSHHGLTPPCCEAVSKAGIKSVFIGIEDPYCEVKGRGIEYLTKNGVEVNIGLYDEVIRQDLKEYLERVTHP